MIKKSIFLLFFSLTSLFFSCKKESINLLSFKEITAPSTYPLASVWFIDDLRGYVCGGDTWTHGFVASTKDGGSTWHTDTITPKKLECLQFDATGQGYVCGLDGLMMFLEPNKLHWQGFKSDFCWYRACYFPSPQYGVAVSGEGWKAGILRHYNPQFWNQDTSQTFVNELNAVWYSDSITAFASGMGQVLRSKDAGKNWERLPYTDDQYLAIHFPTKTDGYIIGQNGTLLKTTDNGQNWQILNAKKGAWGKNNQLRSVWFSSANTGYIVGDQGLFWKTTDGGFTWLPIVNAPEDIDFTDVFMFKNQGWITAKNGRMFHFEE
jgi:photosystem II stability/assembly factor-like uncharacterized protein